MHTIWLLQYNNYYNRIVKKEENLSDYQGYQVKYKGQIADSNGNTAVIQDVNFITGDFVDTTLVVNWGGDLPDYLLVIDEDNNIYSHWFVVDSIKTRASQLNLTLHRDLVVDFYGELTDEKTSIFVEKANVPASNDLIFNSENMSFNQIKKKETLLKDNSECPWICIYAASKNADGSTTTFEVETGINIPISRVFSSMEEFNNWSVKRCFDQGKYLAGGLPQLISITARGVYRPQPTNPSWRTYEVYEEGDTYLDTSSKNIEKTGDLSKLWNASEVGALFQTQWESIRQALVNYYNEYPYADQIIYDNEAYQAFSGEVNQFVQVNTTGGTQYYKISQESQNGFSPYIFTPNAGPSAGSIYSATKSVLDKIYDPRKLQSKKCVDYFYAIDAAKKPRIENITNSVKISGISIDTNRYNLIDAPYDLFCMPYSDSLQIKNTIKSGFVNVTSSKQLSIDITRQLIMKYSQAGQIYDAQILPYCPLTSTIISKSDGSVTMDLNDSSGKAYTPILSDNAPIGYILHATLSSFSRQIQLENPIVISDYKIESECDLYRLCSPNYNGVFEFNAAKNGGVEEINIQCTYKPFTPYIKLYPKWGRLYGQNFGNDDFDARGLICGGDFSLPATTSAWETYELQNKNYQNSFDRHIQNLEVNNAVQREREIWGIASGALGAGVQGASAGLMAGGAVGGVIGSVLGAGASLVGGLEDRRLNEKLRAENIDYTRDQFGYQLGNIKALPQSLSKVSAYNIDNKYFPFLEYYTCSDVEKQALRDKIKFNGMTVMVIGTLKQYIDGYQGVDPMYFKGKIIRITNFSADYHVLEALYNEIYKGVFIK